MAEQEESSSSNSVVADSFHDIVVESLLQTQPYSDFSDFDLVSFLAADLNSMHADTLHKTW